MSALLAIFVVAATPPSLEQALQQAVTRSPAKVELVAWEAPRCKGQFEPAPFEASGRVAVRVRGKGCEAWGWAQVRVLVPIVTLTRDVKAEEPLAEAIVTEEREARAGVLEQLPVGAVATRSLRRGATVSPGDVRVGPRPGTQVTVRVLVGALSLEQRGTATSCGGLTTSSCATLPSGKRVAGVFNDGVLLVGGDL
jgi:flagella basal body P-ring formation protein FlgA